MVIGVELNSADVVVIGGGPGGYSVALEAAQSGAEVVLVERDDRLGGVCLNAGCIPSKALIHVADLASSLPAAAEMGIDATVTIDLKRVRAWIDAIVTKLDADIAEQLTAAGVQVIQGSGRFVSPTRCAVTTASGTQFIDFRDAVVATGSHPIGLAEVPFDGDRVIDSTGALGLDELPNRLVVVGGGYVGLELGTAFAKLGSVVTVVEAQPELLGSFERGLVRPVLSRLEQLGVSVVLGARVEGLDSPGLVVWADGAQRVIATDVTVVAVGRRPSTDGLDLGRAGVGPLRPSGHIDVDQFLRASAHIYAIGDVTVGAPLAHRAFAQAKVVGALLRGGQATFEPTSVPMVVYSDPEIMSVGMTLAIANAAGFAATRVVIPMSSSGRAATLGATSGRVEVVFEPVSGVILGVHAVGAGAAELSGESSLLIEMRCTMADLEATMHAHPTLSEVLNDAATASRRHDREAIR